MSGDPDTQNEDPRVRSGLLGGWKTSSYRGLLPATPAEEVILRRVCLSTWPEDNAEIRARRKCINVAGFRCSSSFSDCNRCRGLHV